MRKDSLGVGVKFPVQLDDAGKARVNAGELKKLKDQKKRLQKSLGTIDAQQNELREQMRRLGQ